MWGAPTDDQCAVGYGECKTALRELIAAKSASAREHPHREISLPNGGIIRYRSLDNPDNAVGHTADGIVIDEAADVDPEAYSKILRPMLMDTGGWAWIISTPEGRNWFYDGWQEAARGEVADSAAWQAPSLGVEIRDGQLLRCPHPLENECLAWGEVYDIWRTQPERIFQQEIMAEFLEDAGGVFRGVKDASTGSVESPQEGRVYTVGVDWGQADDYTVFSVIDASIRPARQVLLERSNQVGYQLQLGRLRQLMDDYRPTVVLAELNSMGSPLVEQLQSEGYPVQGFNTTNASKKAAIEALALALERKDVVLLDNELQIDELESFAAERLPSGMVRYSAPAGRHDDTVIALALAWQFAKSDYSQPEDEKSAYERANEQFLKLVRESNPRTERFHNPGWGTRRV